MRFRRWTQLGKRQLEAFPFLVEFSEPLLEVGFELSDKIAHRTNVEMANWRMGILTPRDEVLRRAAAREGPR